MATPPLVPAEQHDHSTTVATATHATADKASSRRPTTAQSLRNKR